MHNLRNLTWPEPDVAAILQVLDYQGSLSPPSVAATSHFEGRAAYKAMLTRREIKAVELKTGDNKRAVRALVHGDEGSPGSGAARFQISGVPDYFAIEESALDAGVSLEDAWKQCRLAVIEELSGQQGASVESRPAVTEALLEGCIYECSREALSTPATRGACACQRDARRSRRDEKAQARIWGSAECAFRPYLFGSSLPLFFSLPSVLSLLSSCFCALSLLCSL